MALTEQDFKDVAEPKYTSLIHLDQVTRSKCKDTLQYFVAFSSLAAGRGATGQSNYSWANACMERVCVLRKEAGLPGEENYIFYTSDKYCLCEMSNINRHLTRMQI